jgi:glycosyltransferase involved in cell wall biosynthesis
MYNDIIVFHSGHFSDNCHCSFCLNRRGVIEALKSFNFNVYIKTFGCDWNSYYPANIHFDYAIKYQNKIFGSFMFEADKMPSRVIDFAERYFDYIICGSNFLKEAWINSGIEEKYLIHSGCGINTNIFKVDTNIRSIYPGKFKFLSVGAWQGGAWQDRKGFLLLIKTFNELFSRNDKVMLILKTNSVEAKKYETHNIKIILDNYNDIQMANLYQSCAREGVFIHPHKGEGYGRGILEALHCGMRIGTTGYSGVLDFVNSNNAELFRYNLTPTHIYPGTFYKDNILPNFANPDIGQIKDWMLRVSKTKEINYKHAISIQHTWKYFVDKLLKDIRERI